MQKSQEKKTLWKKTLLLFSPVCISLLIFTPKIVLAKNVETYICGFSNCTDSELCYYTTSGVGCLTNTTKGCYIPPPNQQGCLRGNYSSRQSWCYAGPISSLGQKCQRCLTNMDDICDGSGECYDPVAAANRGNCDGNGWCSATGICEPPPKPTVLRTCQNATCSESQNCYFLDSGLTCAADTTEGCYLPFEITDYDSWSGLNGTSRHFNRSQFFYPDQQWQWAGRISKIGQPCRPCAVAPNLEELGYSFALSMQYGGSCESNGWCGMDGICHPALKHYDQCNATIQCGPPEFYPTANRHFTFICAPANLNGVKQCLYSDITVLNPDHPIIDSISYPSISALTNTNTASIFLFFVSPPLTLTIIVGICYFHSRQYRRRYSTYQTRQTEPRPIRLVPPVYMNHSYYNRNAEAEMVLTCGLQREYEQPPEYSLKDPLKKYMNENEQIPNFWKDYLHVHLVLGVLGVLAFVTFIIGVIYYT